MIKKILRNFLIIMRLYALANIWNGNLFMHHNVIFQIIHSIYQRATSGLIFVILYFMHLYNININLNNIRCGVLASIFYTFIIHKVHLNKMLPKIKNTMLVRILTNQVSLAKLNTFCL